ncbi:hypothetical protein [Myxococcus stipitatus]|uniref:hypothetical protein n=1 Tax=Myxococcus stipitatus TaxID=83455 RepID=UPI0030D0620F
MNLNAIRVVTAAGSLFTSTLAVAQDVAPQDSSPVTGSAPAPRPPSYRAALSLGVAGGPYSAESALSESPVIDFDLERRVDGAFTIFVGPTFATGKGEFPRSIGAHAGSRYFFGEQIHDGMYVSLQGNFMIFNDGDTKDGHRFALSGLFGYAQPISEGWVLSLGAGIEGSMTSTTETTVSDCYFFSCKTETTTEFERNVQPHVKAGATFRF